MTSPAARVYRTTQGRLIALGMDPVYLRLRSDMVAWSDIHGKWLGDYEGGPKPADVTFDGGFVRLPVPIDFQWVRVEGENLFMYKTEYCVEMIYTGSPYVYSFKILRAEPP